LKVNQVYLLKIIVLISFCLALNGLNGQTFVKETATGSASGVDWDNALGANSLKSTIEAGGTVYIAEGTYVPASAINLTMNIGHFIQGGFPATATGTDLSGYDPSTYPTIIDGGGSIQLLDNASRLDTFHLTGLTLQNANGIDGSAFQSDFSNTNPIEYVFTDLVVQNCTASGLGTFSVESKTHVDSKISFSNCTFLNNSAGDGGAIYMLSVYNTAGSSAVPGNFNIDGCTFEGNTSSAIGGGAIMLRSSNGWTISNCDFCNNTATTSRGGALHLYLSYSDVIENTNFFENSTNEFGGAIYGSFTTTTITNSVFVGNSSTPFDGGAILGTNSSWQIDATNFYNNTAGNGGAIKSSSWYSNIRSSANNCIFSGNEATGLGTVSGTNGGGALCIGSNVNPNGWDIDSCTFVNNTADANSWGGAISHGEIESTLTNSLFYNNTKGGNAGILGSDIVNYDNTGGFYIMSGNKMQLADSTEYDNQITPNDASSYAFTDDTFSNIDDGSVPAAPASPCLTAFNISGTIFEDINYGGGDGRTFTTAYSQAPGWSANDIGLSGVTIELYDNAGGFIKDTVSNVNGQYSFLNLPSGNYSIRVVNNTIISNRESNGTGEIIIPVQSFRTDGTTDVINEVGGAMPALIDTTTNSASANLSTLTSITATVQTLTPITVIDNHLTGLDFGFNFDVIVNTNDSGQGSLRQFILNSNELDNTDINQRSNPPGRENLTKDLGWETSIFEIPGGGVHVIQPLTALPIIDDPMTHLTGYTQNDASQDPISSRTINIELNGNTTAFDGLSLRADSLQVSGLSIHGFRRGIYAPIIGSEEIFIWGNYIGMEADGLTPSSNDASGIHFSRNVNSFIGTNGDNVNDANEGNLISKSDFGIQMTELENVLIAGNFIGTDKTGLVNQGNLFVGVYASFGAHPNYIGFKDNMPNSDANQFRNIISANGNDGIRIIDSDSLQVSGNYIGTDFLGTGLLANVSYGIQLTGNCNNNIIGTNSNGAFDVSERNVIVGNVGLRFASSGTGDRNIAAGNYFGTDYTGTIGLSGASGIFIYGGFTNTIIGTNGDNINDEIEYNIISGHLNDGIRMSSIGDAIIAGNGIGIAADWSSHLGNLHRGIYIQDATSNTTIGWSSSMTNIDELIVGNQIKNNGDSGVAINGSGTNNRISRNQIANNDGLGIGLNNPLGDFSVTPNDDGDADTGENNLLNFPVIDSIYMLGNDLTVTGFAPANSTIEFYIPDTGPNPDPLPPAYTSNFGEGMSFIDAANEGGPSDVDLTSNSYTDDGTGSVTSKSQNRFQFTFDVTSMGLFDNTPITALAIDATNNTSEFGNIRNIVEVFPDEICNNGIDDDGDGDIDCADGDCASFDTDGDLTCDYDDLDNDNDGIPDSEEHCGVTTEISGTVGLGNQLTSTTYSLSNTDITYTRSGSNEGSITGYDGMVQGPMLRIQSSSTTDGILSSTFSNPIGSVNFKITDFDGLENVTVNVYDENNVLYDLTVEGLVSIGSLINQTGNQFVALTSTYTGGINVDGDNPSDDHLGSVIFYFPGIVSRIDIIYVQTEDSSVRISQPTFCTGDADGDNVFNHFDLDSDNDGIFDLEEAGHGQVDANADGILDGAPSAFGANGLFDGVETVAENGILNYTISDSDNPQNGIYDAFELDADGDGCYDTNEANIDDNDQDGIAGTGVPTVNLEGLVNEITYSATPNNNWQNSNTIPLVCDTDNDMIPPSIDLDDDNDGIPDIEEGCQLDTILIWNELSPSFTNVSNGSPSTDQSLTYTNEDGNYDYTFEVDNPDDNYFNRVSIGSYQALGINASALDSLGDFAEITINIDNVPSEGIFQEILFTIDDIDRGGSVNTREVVTVVGYNGATAISPIVTAQQTGFLVITPPAPDQSISTTTTTSDNLPFLPGDSNASGTAEQAAIDVLFNEPIDRIVIRYSQTGEISPGGLGVRQFMGTYCADSDGDGIINSLDLDSDNDGIFDLDESGHVALDANSDGIIDGIAGVFGTNGLFDGVETVADNGILNYSIADSETTPDGIYDAYELDADEDTCFDALEEGITDGDADGVAGSGIPTVDGNGLVTAIIYSSPTSADWQDPLIAVCAPSCSAQAPVLNKN